MNTRLLRLCRKDSRGRRSWVVPGFGNAITYTPFPTGSGTMQWGRTVRWPGRDAKGEFLRGVDLDRHYDIARAEIRALLEAINA